MDLEELVETLDLGSGAARCEGEKEVAKRRAGIFFRLKQGEFVAFADGKDKKVQFKLQKIRRVIPKEKGLYSNEDLKVHFERFFREVNTNITK